MQAQSGKWHTQIHRTTVLQNILLFCANRVFLVHRRTTILTNLALLTPTEVFFTTSASSVVDALNYSTSVA